MDRLKQLREPAAVVTLVGLALHFALTLIYFLVAPASFNLFLVDLALSLVNPVLVALLAVLVASCWIPEATPRARGLSLLGLILTAGMLATALGMLVAGLVREPEGALSGLVSVFGGVVPWLTTAVIALGVYLALLRRPSIAASPAATAEVAPPEPVPAAPVDPQLQPGWSPEAAVGTVWRRAGDAAAGAPATSWDPPGTSGDPPGQTTGWWGPAPGKEPPSSVAPDQPATGQTPSVPTAERPVRPGDWSSPSPS